MNKSGKTLTIFLGVLSALFLSLSGIALYYYTNERKSRESAESTIEQLKDVEAKLQGDLKDTKKQVFVLEEKNKEADGKINDLMDNLELEKSLREEAKKENATLKEALQNESQSKEKIRTDLTQQLNASQEKLTSIESELTTSQNKVSTYETQNQAMQEKIKHLEADLQKNPPTTTTAAASDMSSASASSETASASANPNGNLDKIVVAPPETTNKTTPEGRVLSVDKENEFLIVNLGEKDGVTPGSFLSVYRGNDYLGDVRISRVQPDMSAADFVPPFSSQKVRKNDQVVAKK